MLKDSTEEMTLAEEKRFNMNLQNRFRRFPEFKNLFRPRHLL